MAKRKAKANKLAGLIHAAPLARTHDWLAELSLADRKDVIEVRRDFQAGAFGGRAPTTIYKIIHREIKLTCGRDRFILWLQGQENGPAR